MKYYIVDAFTDSLFSGNPAGVCLLDAPIEDDIMQSIAAENNLAETAFLLKQSNSYSLRWFTPEQEFDLCGHATLASAYVLYNSIEKDATTLRFETLSGELNVVRKGSLLEMDFPSRPPKPIKITDIMKCAVGTEVLGAYLSRDMILELPSEKHVLEAKPDLNLVAQIPDCDNMVITARGEHADFVLRFFTPGISIPEDPVTGSAHASLIPLWAKKLGKQEMQAYQLSQRGGVLYCKYCGDRVLISGNAVLYLKGEIMV